MQFVTVRDFRNSSKAIWDKVKKDSEIVVTNNGKPTALLISIKENNFEETLASVRQAKSMRVFYRMRDEAERRGFMNDKEIESEISAIRADYKSKTGKTL
jgi:prevent-host-death family protein